MAGKLYGAKCHKCQHVKHPPTRDDVPLWPANDDDCAACYECQHDAFYGALLRSHGESIFDPEVREALTAFRNNRSHPIIDTLRAECQEIERGGSDHAPSDRAQFRTSPVGGNPQYPHATEWPERTGPPIDIDDIARRREAGEPWDTIAADYELRVRPC